MDIIDANAKAIDEFGYSKPEILELSVFDLHPKIEQPHSEEVLEQVKKSDSEDPLKVIGKFQRKDKSIFTAEAQPIKCTYLGKDIIQVIIKNLSNDDSITMDS
jgi:PAS domain S-box-containing protein